MKASRLGVLSALIASICCVGPLLLILLGLGSLGISAVIGKYHWYFMATALVLITFSWRRYLREKKACSLKGCQMANRKITLVILIITTLVVAVFVSLNIYTYAVQKDFSEGKSGVGLAEIKTVIIPVEGMTCFTCELTVSSALKKTDGVVDARASAKEGKVEVKYNSSEINIRQLVETINKTGYKANLPK